MDIPTFFEFFEKYRQERHINLIRIREERSANYKVMGKGNLPRPDRNLDPEAFIELYNTFLNGDEQPS
jgi:hypothetical protein